MANTGVSAMLLSRPEEANAAGHLVSRAGEGAASGPLLPSNSSPTDTEMKGCANGDLMDSFGIFLQGLLGVVAFSTLMLKRFREPKHERRPWRIWFLDTSKQAIGMLFIHFANVYLSDLTEEDPCSLYLINFLLDATLGMLVIYGGVKAVSAVVEWRQWDSLRFGEYGEPVQCTAWAGQCALYILIMMFEKVVIILVLLIPQWKKLAMLNPITNPQLELALVMLIVPFFVNALMFWVVDNFLMKKGRTKAKLEEREVGDDSRGSSKVRYRRALSHDDSESELAMLNPITNPQLELALVMLIVPFFVNALMFWVVDNFLMKKGRTKAKLEEREVGDDSRGSSKVRYRRALSHDDSESEILFSADDEMEDSDGDEDVRRLTGLKTVKKKKHRLGIPV
ncbi:hypothetical protein PDJAM_G00116460 [Pangasius djambal]|uniref:Uncharacterized protein n=1 Tax=Pangasius djambal TaxID=1691987 RepID=A0ACC5Z918_9TELE|nr:hypothetical protein [Pangasius djambal]